jgi:phosphate uptake regulator
MLKEIAELWRDSKLMQEVIQKLAEMVADSEYVFVHAWEVCRGQAVASETKGPLREHDRAVNRNEREIRRMLVEHLSINPGKDTSGCLALLIMAKDAERLGDHGRNIFDVAARAEGKLREVGLFNDLDGVCERIARVFPVLQRAILDSDEALAHEILDLYQGIKEDLKGLQDKLFDADLGLQQSLFGADLSAPQAVMTTLMVRYLMRINAHMGNIASGIIFPIQNIDFVSRGLKEEQKDR